jgi:uncharacterized protein (DUF885 family)
LATLLLAALPAAPAAQAPSRADAEAERLVQQYLARYFAFYPSRATQAGHRDYDRQLERFSPSERAAWIRFNGEVLRTTERLLARPTGGDRGAGTARPSSDSLGSDARLDLAALRAQAEQEWFDLETRQRAQRDPLFWSQAIGGAFVYLLMREERPLADRVAAVQARLRLVPALVDEGMRSLRTAPDDVVVADLARIAARQAQSGARFYREGLVRVAEPLGTTTVAAVQRDGERAARRLEAFGAFLDSLARRATGSARLGARYAEIFRVGTGIDEPVDSVLARAERDLVATRAEVAAYARRHWERIAPGQALPTDDRAVVAAAFAQVEAARDTSVAEYLAYWRSLPDSLEAFVRERQITTLPAPRTLAVDIAPSYMSGQSVGGVYSAGPYAPDATTILFVPIPADGATSAQRDVFFRDFNRPFTKMIAAHELMPGHYAQLKHSARHPRAVRTVFSDGVYTEGWGTFVERIMLDAGWGGPLEYLAHYKKAMENIARTIVDIRVHTKGMTREAMGRLVREEALQGEQLATNMWTRTLTTAPQITTYYLGARQIRDLHDAVRARDGASFSLPRFMDAMVAEGSVPIPALRERLLGR